LDKSLVPTKAINLESLKDFSKGQKLVHYLVTKKPMGLMKAFDLVYHSKTELMIRWALTIKKALNL
jgi:hypothetical protein